MADRQLRTRVVRALGGAATAVALLGGGTALAANQAVAISGFAFSPATVTVNVGDPITWTNSDSVAHTATADDASWNTGNIAGGGGTGSVTFATAGSFPYHCTIHPQMTGTVTVQAAAVTPVPAAGATTPPTDTALAAADGDEEPGSRTAAGLVILAIAWIAGLGALRRRLSVDRR